jgi:hypothetical protein
VGTVVGKEDEIKRLYRNKLSVSRIARELGVPTTAVSRKLEHLGLRERIDPRVVPEADRQAIADLYKSKVPTKEIQLRFDISQRTVLKIARQLGVVVNSRGQQYKEFSTQEAASMAAEWRGGLSLTIIAKQHGSSPTVVGRILRNLGAEPTVRHAKGARHGNWNGGRSKTGGGYWQIRVDGSDPLAPMRNRIGYILEHRLVMARHLGRLLRPDESVHHINGDKSDNRLENLQLRHGPHGKNVCLRCGDCGSTNLVHIPLADGEH